MAKPQSEAKREAIITHGKRLFAERGFAGTSVSAIAKKARVPVGSIYTYFANKDELLRAIVEDGWSDLWQRLNAAVERESTPEQKLHVLIDRFLPEVVAESEFVSILLTEAADTTELRAKIDSLVTLLESIIAPLRPDHPALNALDRKQVAGALLVYFLGTLNAVKLSSKGSLGISLDHILSYLKLTVMGTLRPEKQR